jgi:hypothetical protein
MFLSFLWLMVWVGQPIAKHVVSVAPDVTPVPIMSHGNYGCYLIVIDIISLQHVELLGIDVTMHVIDN